MTDFSELGLSPQILQAVADSGYTTATPIQAEAIPVALAGLDVLGIAQTGTGKTAAFTLPMIERLASGRAKARMPRALVIAPTRELADQVASAFDKYAKGTKLSWALLIGGVSFGDQEKKLDRGVDVLIATPGRLLDHFERGKLLMTSVQILVVDEADRMLDMGFIPDIERIFKLTPPKKQTLFFSATMPPEITRLTQQFLNNPVRIEVTRAASTNENITQYLARIPISDPKAKRMALRDLVARAEVKNGIVFCNRKSEVDVVAKSLKAHGFDAAAIHGDLDQSVRTRTLESFRSGELKLLVASDVAARGLDIPAVSHVFNYDVPHHADDYVHRIGRTGRAGRTGEAYMIITPADAKSLDKVLKLIGKTPAEAVLDLDWSQAAGGDEGRGRRDRSARERPTGRVKRERDAAPREREPSTEHEASSEQEAPRERTAPPRERKPRAPREARPPREAAVAEAAPAAAPQREPAREAPRDARPAPIKGSTSRTARPEPAPERDHERERRDDGPRVRGFGGDTPAFLLRSTRLAQGD